MGQRSRKRGRRTKSAVAAPSKPAPQSGVGKAGRRASSEERNQAVRATLQPIGPGERPWPLAVSALIAFGLVVANLVLLIAHVKFKIGSEHASVASQILYLVVMGMCAYGLWRARYWAVLGFMVILLLVIIAFTLLLIRADNAIAVVVAVVIVGPGSFLFYKLVRVMSRIQMPRPPGS